jgi:NTE family protein
MTNNATNFPSTNISLVEPRPEDADMFFTDLFSYHGRRRSGENACQSTRLMLCLRRSVLGPLLWSGMVCVCAGPSCATALTLVKHPLPERGGHFGHHRLNDALAALERHLKIAAG